MGVWGSGPDRGLCPRPQTPITKHQVTKGPNFISSPPVPPGKARLGSPRRSEVTRPRGQGAQSASAAAPGPPGPSAPSCACRRWGSPGCGRAGGRVRARAAAGLHQARCPAQGWSGPFPGLWPRPAAHPPPSRVGLFAQRAWGGGAITAGARGGAGPPAVYHLSPGVGTRPAHPFPGESPAPPWGRGSVQPSPPGQILGARPCPTQQLPTPTPGRAG